MIYFRNGIQIQLVLFLLYVTHITSACRSSIDKRSTKCILPPYPKHGSYEVAGDPAAKPGDELEYVYLNVSCEHNSHGVIGNNVVLCILGEWSTTMPECVPVCYLQEHPSVTYSCNSLGAEEFGACGEYEPLGASVKAECQLGYYSPEALPRMRCVNGTWTFVAQCTPECGLMSDSVTLPWYAFIYRKKGISIGKYQPLCGGTIISPNIVISAAHCFWNQTEGKVKTSGDVVVAGKKYWADISDAEKFPVAEVKATELFQETVGNFQHDIALVILSKAFTYSRRVHPVCLNFDYEFKKKQMQEGNLGTLGVFPFPMLDQSLLQVSKIPYIPVRKCIAQAPPTFRVMITGDKFCTDQVNGTLICHGNNGTGLAFPGDQQNITRYYLRGVFSTAPPTEQQCAPTIITAFTEVYYHRDFIQDHLTTSLTPRMMGWLKPEDFVGCYLQEHASVTYSCKKVDADEFGVCGEDQPLGASVKAECRPGYYSPEALPQMICVNGTWTFEARCTPECGLMSDNTTLPWYAYIYRKKEKSIGKYQPLCGGTIISPNIVISAAHCFWNQTEGMVKTSGDVVVAGKKYWGDISDEEKFPVAEVKATELFQEAVGNFQHDIALVILGKAFTFSRRVHPVCLNFDYEFKKKQMQEGNLGTLGVFPFPMLDQSLLQVSKIPYIPVRKCIAQTPPTFRGMITGDKFCTDQDNDTLICRGNNGTGLAFPGDQKGITRYYLRGVFSTAPPTEQQCAPTIITAFTEVYYHKDFINEHLVTSLPPRMKGWLEPEDVVGCYLQEHPSVTYSCKKVDADEFGVCGEYQPLGASVKAECQPGYYSPKALPRMRCVNGTWTFVAQCIPECGLMSDNATLPWYAYIYRKKGISIGKYQPMCGGTIISPNIVISAGHCFWHEFEGMVETSGDVVVAGKKYFGDISDKEKFPVARVKLTERFQGAATNYQEDIALVILSKAFTYSRKLSPVCLDFDFEFKKKQMQEGNLGTVGVFPFPMVDQSLLQVSKISYVPARKCIAQVPATFIVMITADKFCAGQDNGTLICRGNSGTGLAFPGDQQGITRYYLRGIVSTAPTTEELCAPTNFIALTEVYYHKDFINEHLATSLPPRMKGWLEPEDVVGCYLQEHPSVTYSCKKVDADEFGVCGEYQPLGASVKAECQPGYYSPKALPRMRCVNGTWTYVAQCTPECGLMSDNATLPWYAYIYRKKGKSIGKYQPLCGGTIISPNIVISAAHCFWHESKGMVETSGDVVVAGNKYFGDISDKEKFPVARVKLTERFQGAVTNYQEDIALVILSKAFTYSRKLNPVCLDFDFEFKTKQMQEGNLGTLGVFPFPMVDQSLLQVSKISYVPIRKCIAQVPATFIEMITADKFCAGLDNGTLICRGNSGTGLTFPSHQRGMTRHYLRGIVSTAPTTEQLCGPTNFIALTEIYYHKDFIKEHLATSSLPPRVVRWLDPEPL